MIFYWVLKGSMCLHWLPCSKIGLTVYGATKCFSCFNKGQFAANNEIWLHYIPWYFIWLCYAPAKFHEITEGSRVFLGMSWGYYREHETLHLYQLLLVSTGFHAILKVPWGYMSSFWLWRVSVNTKFSPAHQSFHLKEKNIQEKLKNKNL